MHQGNKVGCVLSARELSPERISEGDKNARRFAQPTIFTSTIPIRFFHHTTRKVRTVRPAGEKQPTYFTLLVEKISICITGVSKESLRSHICHPRLRLG